MAKLIVQDFEGISLMVRKKFESNLGSFSVTYEPDLTPNTAFHQDSISIIKNQYTLKGMHMQYGAYAQSKLVTVLQGSITDFFIDLRKGSKTYLDYGSVDINESNANIIFIPSGFAHGYITLESNTIISYKLGASYSPEHELTLMWNDARINIDWPVKKNLYMSEKDLSGLSFNDIEKKL